MRLINGFERENAVLDGEYVYCSWCMASGRPKDECKIPRQEIGGIDTQLKQAVCKDCLDAALKIEMMLSNSRQQEISLAPAMAV